MKQHWMSFADPELPKGTQFLGVCIVEADTFMEAVEKSHALKINPGGSIQSHEIEGISSEYLNILFSKNDLMELGLI